MKPLVTLFIFITCLVSCAQDKKRVKGETDFQREINAEYKDATKSPLKDKDRKNFEFFLNLCLDYNKVAKSSNKRKPR